MQEPIPGASGAYRLLVRLSNNRRLAVAIFILLFSVAYFAETSLAAARRAFWYDELFTYFVASRPSIGSIWNALLGGMDLHPPLDFIVRHFALRIPGPAELTLRLPSILALYGTFAAVFVYGRAAHSAVAGICAVTLFALTPAMDYAIEARSYALLLLDSAIVLLLWRKIVNTPGAPIWLWLAIGVCVGLASWLHYYGTLLLLPLVTGGIALWASSRRFPWKLLVSLLAAMGLIGSIVPFATRARPFADNFWAKPPAFYVAVGVSLRSYGEAIALFVAFALVLTLTSGRMRRSNTPDLRLSAPERTVLFTMALLPVVQWVMAKYLTNAFDMRYTIENLIAGCILLGMAATALIENAVLAEKAEIPVGVVAVTCLVVATGGLFSQSSLRKNLDLEANAVAGLWGDGAASIYSLSGALAQVHGIEQLLSRTALPVLSPHPQSYLVQFYYGSPEVKQRLILPVDDTAALKAAGLDSEYAESEYRGLRDLARFVPLRLVPYRQIVDGQRPALLAHGKYGRDNWILRRLVADGYRLQLPTGLEASKEVAWECLGPAARPGEAWRGTSADMGVRAASAEAK